MAWAVYEESSQTTSGTTEHALGTDNDGTDGIFVHYMDISDLADAERIEIRLYEKARSADTVRCIGMWDYANAQNADFMLWISPVLGFRYNRRFTVKATAGSGIVLPWSVWKM